MSSLSQTERASVTACGPPHLSSARVPPTCRPEFERDADDIVALLDQKRRRRRGINSSAHAADHALTLLRIHRRTLYKARAACKTVCKAMVQLKQSPRNVSGIAQVDHVLIVRADVRAKPLE